MAKLFLPFSTHCRSLQFLVLPSTWEFFIYVIVCSNRGYVLYPVLFNTHLYLSVVLLSSFWGDLIIFSKSLMPSSGSARLPFYYSVTRNY